MEPRRDKNIIIKYLVLAVDALLVGVCLLVVVHVFPDHVPASVSHNRSVATLFMLVGFALFSFVFPMTVHERRISLATLMRRNVLVALCTQILFAVIWHLITRHSDEELAFNALMFSTLSAALVALRLFERQVLEVYRSRGHNTRTVLFVGSDPALLAVYDIIISDPATGYRMLGYYSNDVVADAPEGLTRLGSRADMRQAFKAGSLEHVHEVYCSLSHKDTEDLEAIIHYCNHHAARFFYVPRVLQYTQLALKPQIIGGSVVYTSYYEPLASLGNRIVKRVFDIVASITVLLVLAPLVPLIALIIKTQSRGPLFFAQRRTGLGGDTFRCYKFRSMHPNSSADSRQAVRDDDRCFPFGRFMRRTSIDELPQFYNVLRGDMSIVGPRPHMLAHTEAYDRLLEKYMVRHMVKPGITGYAQTHGCRGETAHVEQMAERVRKDIWYIENWSFMLDIKLCWLTALLIIKGDDNAV